MALIVLATFVDPSTGLRVEATAGSGFSIVMDADDADLPATAATPREALLAALAGCTAMDVASILRKKRQRPSSYRISAVGETRQDVAALGNAPEGATVSVSHDRQGIHLTGEKRDEQGNLLFNASRTIAKPWFGPSDQAWAW